MDGHDEHNSAYSADFLIYGKKGNIVLVMSVRPLRPLTDGGENTVEKLKEYDTSIRV
jgi:hypothetical protein